MQQLPQFDDDWAKKLKTAEDAGEVSFNIHAIVPALTFEFHTSSSNYLQCEIRL